jgi:putative peptidoglycan lipid II flippase
MSQKFTSTIAGASIFISLLGLASRGLGFFREMIFANNFGLETVFDLYLVGAVLPITINTIILYIGQNYFIPEYQKKYATDPEEAQKYFKQSFMGFTLAGILLAALLYLTGNIIIDFYMHSASPASRELATQVFNILLLTIPFCSGISILSALLQTVYEFKYPAISVLYLNMSIIIMIFALIDKIGIFVIPIGYLIGTLLQFFYLQFKSRKYYKLNLVIHLRQFYLLKSIIGSSLLIILVIESIGQLYSILDRYFLGYISSGGIASLNYAYIIFLLPISIFSVSLATVVFPKITQAIVRSSKNELQRIYNESISINILIFMPLTFLLFNFGETIIKIAFERGKFFGDSTTITYNVLKCYSISLVFYSIYSVINKMFYSLNLTKLLLVITIIGIILKMIFNFLLVERYQQYGLAISTSISFIFFFSISYLIINRKLEVGNKTLFIKEFCFYFINCCVCLLLIKIISNVLPDSNIIIEILAIAIFVILYLLNLILINHKVIVILNQVFPKLILSSLIRTS